MVRTLIAFTVVGFTVVTAAEDGTLQRTGAAGDAEAANVRLMEIHPDFRRAMILLGEEDIASAKQLLAGLAESDDKLLAAESAYFHARAYVLEEDCEQALLLLTAFDAKHGEHSLRRMEVDFFIGVCQAQLLQRREAIASLRRFLRENPAAPDRMRIAAREKLAQLGGIDEGTLADVQDRMEFVRRRLAIQQSGGRTQQEQDNIIAMLDRLIDRDGGDGPSPPPRPRPPPPPGPPDDHPPHPGPNAPGPRGGPNGKDGEGGDGAAEGDPQHRQPALRRTARRVGDESWDHVRDKDREAKALAALHAKFPERYAELVKQYYRSCMDGMRREFDE